MGLWYNTTTVSHIYVTGLEIGICNWRDSLCITVRNDHRHADGCTGGAAWLYCTWAWFFLPEEGHRWSWHHLSLCLCRGLGLYMERMHKSWGSHLGLFAVHSVTFHEEPQTLYCSYLSASKGVRLQLYRRVFFVCSAVSVQGYLGHPELVCFHCLWVNNVSHLPASLRSCIRAGRTAIFQCELVHMG